MNAERDLHFFGSDHGSTMKYAPITESRGLSDSRPLSEVDTPGQSPLGREEAVLKETV